MKGGAILSDCRRYRYWLYRTWDEGSRLCFVMLNPSTADELVDDRTISVCIRRAQRKGYAGLDVVNLFAYRATYPKALYDLPNGVPITDPYQPEAAISEPNQPYRNDAIIERVTRAAALVICAWGKHGAYLSRGKIVLQRLKLHGVTPHALKLNLDGSPAHPLYIKSDQEAFPF